MADLTTAATFDQTVQGNRRVVVVTVPTTGGSTADTVSVPYLTAITALYGGAFTSNTTYNTTNSAWPISLNVGSSANAVQVLRSSLTTGDGFRFIVEGR